MKPARTPHPLRAVMAMAAFYSSDAAGYKRLWAPELLRLSSRLLAELPLHHARRVLDVGAGVGSLLPEIRKAAPGALVVGVDIAHGMIALSPRGFPVAAMDASFLALRSRTFDVGILAFVLFHLPDPVGGLGEIARVLSPGGTVGTITWGDAPDYPAMKIWGEELEASGAPPRDRGFARHDLVDTPPKVRQLLDRAGYDSIRTWTGRYENRMTPDEFITHRVGHGRLRVQFQSLDALDRTICLERARSRLERLEPEGLVERAEVIYAIGRIP